MSYDIDIRADHCEHCGRGEKVYSSNMTSNVAPMWRKAGIDLSEWCYEGRPEDRAKDLIPYLEVAVAAMRADPETYRAMNPENGCGDYDEAVRFLERLLDACRKYPEGRIAGSN